MLGICRKRESMHGDLPSMSLAIESKPDPRISMLTCYAKGARYSLTAFIIAHEIPFVKQKTKVL